MLITGESGTGKELVAAAIHVASARRDRPFVRVNCAAIPRDLVESELFGHERGAFTGATDRRIGRFELAHTGTLFLDEVGDLGRRGAGEAAARDRGARDRARGRRQADPHRRADRRRDQQGSRARASRDGTFREDLFFRLNVIPIELPPLRERPGRRARPGAPLLAPLHRARTGTSARRAGASDAIAAIARHRWPGNVRELANIVERLAILHAGER